jgi:VanZ family protein
MGANTTREPHTVSKLQILWALAIAALIVLASSRSRVAGPAIVNIDKVAHFAVYGLLATHVCRVGRGWRAAGWALLAASLFGATDEWHQSWVPGRSPSVADWIADTLGAALAVALYAGWAWYRRLLEIPLWRRPRPVEKT